MANNIKSSFDSIRAEEALKSSTALFLQRELAGRNNVRSRPMAGRYSAALATVFLVLLSGIFTLRMYFTSAAYVDVDVNPSIELTLNRLDRVIGTHAYNEDGVSLLAGLSLTHKSYEDALMLLMESMQMQGYFRDDVFVSVTLQTDDKGKEEALLDHIQWGLEGYLAQTHDQAQIDVFSVSGDTRTHAHAQGMSPAKYLAIQALIEVDPTASAEHCRDHSIREIWQLARENGSAGHCASDGGGHHGGGH